MTQNLPIKIRRYAESTELNQIVGPFPSQSAAQAYYDGICHAILDNSIGEGAIAQYNEDVYLLYKDYEMAAEEITHTIYDPEVLEVEEL